MFFQVGKSFLVIYIPMLCLIFFVLNRIFFALFRYEVSSYFRFYSFWIHLFFITVVQNLRMLVVFALSNMRTLFSTDFTIKLMQTVSVAIFGFFFVFVIALFPLLEYFNGKNSKYLLSNIKYKKYCFIIMFLKFSLKPIL